MPVHECDKAVLVCFTEVEAEDGSTDLVDVWRTVVPAYTRPLTEFEAVIYEHLHTYIDENESGRCSTADFGMFLLAKAHEEPFFIEVEEDVNAGQDWQSPFERESDSGTG